LYVEDLKRGTNKDIGPKDIFETGSSDGGCGYMPIYEYECTKCGKIEEIFQKFSDKPLVKCKHCSGKLHKLISHSSFHLKGTGWYVTDYANKSRPNNAAPKKADHSKASDSPKSAAKKKTATKASDSSAS
jgi:putative FmdB family regulatory protein